MKITTKKNPRRQLKVDVKTNGNVKSVDLTEINKVLTEKDKTYTKVAYDTVICQGAEFHVQEEVASATVFDYLIHGIEKLSFDTSNSKFNFNIGKDEYVLDTINASLYLNNRKKSTLRSKGNNVAHAGFNHWADGRYNIILLYRLVAVLYEIIDKGIIRTTYSKIVVNHTRNDRLTHAQSTLDVNTLELTTNKKNINHGCIWNYINRMTASNIKTDFLSSNREFIKYIETFIENDDMISEQELLDVGAVVDASGYYVIR